MDPNPTKHPLKEFWLIKQDSQVCSRQPCCTFTKLCWSAQQFQQWNWGSLLFFLWDFSNNWKSTSLSGLRAHSYLHLNQHGGGVWPPSLQCPYSARPSILHSVRVESKEDSATVWRYRNTNLPATIWILIYWHQFLINSGCILTSLLNILIRIQECSTENGWLITDLVQYTVKVIKSNKCVWY